MPRLNGSVDTMLKKKTRVDTGSRILYSLAVGSILDLTVGGLRTFGSVAAARGTATGINTITSKWYGLWQDKWYNWLKTTPETRKVTDVFDSTNITDYLSQEKSKEVAGYVYRRGKQFTTDMLAFNTFEPIVYGLSNIAGQAFNEYVLKKEGIDLQDTWNGMQGLMLFSPFVAPTMRMTMQGARKIFGVKTSAELAKENLDQKVEEAYQAKIE